MYGGSYGVVANRLVAYGGSQTDSVKVKVVDEHFVILHRQEVRGLETILGVVDIDMPDEAEARLYQEAKKIAEKRAVSDKNTVIDITSKAEEIPDEARFYTSSNWGGRNSYNSQMRQRAS